MRPLLLAYSKAAVREGLLWVVKRLSRSFLFGARRTAFDVIAITGGMTERTQRTARNPFGLLDWNFPCKPWRET